MNTIIAIQSSVAKDLKDTSIETVSHGSRNELSLALKVQPSIIPKITLNRKGDIKLKRLRQNVIPGKSPDFVIYEEGIFGLRNQLSVPNKRRIERKIL